MRVTEFGHFLDAPAEIKSNHRRRDDAERKQPLKNTCAFAAIRRREALGQIQRHHDADKSAADALQQPTENQRAVTVRERDGRHAGHEKQPAKNHHRFAAEKIRERAGEQS